MRNNRRACGRATILASIVCLCRFASMPAPTAKSQTNSTRPALVEVADVPMPGAAVRFDYQTFDPVSGRLYISHMDADQLVVFDSRRRQLVANLDGFKRLHGVAVATEIHRLYASTTGTHEVTAVDTESLKIAGTAGPISYPDGLAYAPRQGKVFVSDEHGGVDAVIDAATNKLVASIALGGGAGNTIYDPISGHILVAVHGVNLLAIIDPATNQIIRRVPLPGLKNPHGIALDTVGRVAFIAGEDNHSLAMLDLNSMRVLSTYQVGEDPDVLAYDPGLKRLYVAAESGTVTIFEHSGRKLSLLGSIQMPHAHTVSVDPNTHLVYFPLENVARHPVLRIMRPADQH